MKATTKKEKGKKNLANSGEDVRQERLRSTRKTKVGARGRGRGCDDGGGAQQHEKPLKSSGGQGMVGERAQYPGPYTLQHASHVIQQIRRERSPAPQDPIGQPTPADVPCSETLLQFCRIRRCVAPGSLRAEH